MAIISSLAWLPDRHPNHPRLTTNSASAEVDFERRLGDHWAVLRLLKDLAHNRLEIIFCPHKVSELLLEELLVELAVCAIVHLEVIVGYGAIGCLRVLCVLEHHRTDGAGRHVTWRRDALR